VLLVTARADACDRVAAALRARGAVVTAAGSAEEAIERVADPPDVLVTDLTLPRQDGHSLLETLRGLPGARGHALRAIGVRADGACDDADAVPPGFDIVLPGPMSAADVLGGMRQLMTLRDG
jgi:CheY-like chemotaxis protein